MASKSLNLDRADGTTPSVLHACILSMPSFPSRTLLICAPRLVMSACCSKPCSTITVAVHTGQFELHTTRRLRSR
eukprot:6205010-Pleurochrysis_carterae.AAC.3